jgi:hypothetical protein
LGEIRFLSSVIPTPSRGYGRTEMMGLILLCSTSHIFFGVVVR